jgi:hypothetical protein
MTKASTSGGTTASIVLVTTAAATVVVALVGLVRSARGTKKNSHIQTTNTTTTTTAKTNKPKTKKTRVAKCPFTAESDFLVDMDENAGPTPWDVFADWVSNPSIIPTDAFLHATTSTSSTTTTSPQYKPLAARWLNAGISGQDTPGHLKTGLKRLKDQTWFLVQDPAVHRFVHELQLKHKHLDNTTNSPRYVQEDDAECLAAQREVLELFCLYLPKRYPDYYEFHPNDDVEEDNKKENMKGPYMIVKPLQQTFYLSDYQHKPLELCARMVQEDLIVLRPPRSDGSDQSKAYHMSAAAVCFSFTGLDEKLGQPMEFIHAPVPGFESQLRKTMELFFAKFLKLEQPLWRNNWVVTPEAGGQIDNPNYGTEEADATRQLVGDTNNSGTVTDSTASSSSSPPPPTPSDIDRMFLKVEYQTIRRLPKSNYLLFTVKMMVDPFRELRKVPNAAACLAKSIRGK